MGNVSILVKNGGHKYRSTIGSNSAVRYNNWWLHISNFSNPFKIRSTRSLPSTTGTAMAMDNKHQQNWRKNTLTFRKGKTKIRVSTQEKVATKKDSMPLYA